MDIKLELTNGYRLHFLELSRILGYLKEQPGRKIIPRQEIIEALGMPIRQYESLSSIMVALGLIRPATFVLTPLGSTIAGKDLFFEKEETLWLLHYTVSCNPKWVVWHRLVTQVFPNQSLINAVSCAPYFSDLSANYSASSLERKVPKEINAVLYAYSETHFLKLNFISKIAAGQWKREEPNKITPLPFLFSLLLFQEMMDRKSTGISLTEALTGELSPAKVLNLERYEVEILFDQLHNTRFANLENFGDLHQLRYAHGLSKQLILNEIYH
ncbi:MAG: DUF4007 family protein [Anaerolineales bacterium]